MHAESSKLAVTTALIIMTNNSTLEVLFREVYVDVVLSIHFLATTSSMVAVGVRSWGRRKNPNNIIFLFCGVCGIGLCGFRNFAEESHCAAKLKCLQNWVVEFSASKLLFLDQICKFQKLMQFFQRIESCNSEITFVCAAFRIFSIQDNQYFVEVNIQG